jgi:hypothetical protein
MVCIRNYLAAISKFYAIAISPDLHIGSKGDFASLPLLIE